MNFSPAPNPIDVALANLTEGAEVLHDTHTLVDMTTDAVVATNDGVILAAFRFGAHPDLARHVAAQWLERCQATICRFCAGSTVEPNMVSPCERCAGTGSGPPDLAYLLATADQQLDGMVVKMAAPTDNHYLVESDDEVAVVHDLAGVVARFRRTAYPDAPARAEAERNMLNRRSPSWT